MPVTKLTEAQLVNLRSLEAELRRAVAAAEPEAAIETAGKIQALFGNDRSHHRLLKQNYGLSRHALMLIG